MFKILKLTLLSTLLNELKRMYEQANVNAKEAQEEANYHVGAMESRYDTFKEEAQYLTEAQKLRLLELKAKIQDCEQLKQHLELNNIQFNRLKLGAIVQILSPKNDPIWFFLAPAGLNISHQDPILGTITCITEDAPLVRNAIDLEVGDEYDVSSPEYGKKALWYEIIDIR
ncbi:TPA: hypothetical protein U2M43_003103 [Providencia stuartii]|uniref:hypothetical protein n=1 Tax=Providencia stuartii TaxID=588 RepID=UPI0027FE04EF|nr:hypothetical protein [Providencia stuartii]MDQ5992436.1 hypothetical protein [Providencia stuartii]HEM8302785.1 hypothetical protein [Providencia stuartii]